MENNIGFQNWHSWNMNLKAKKIEHKYLLTFASMEVH